MISHNSAHYIIYSIFILQMNLKPTLDVWKNVASRNTCHTQKKFLYEQSIMHYYDHYITHLSVYEPAIYQYHFTFLLCYSNFSSWRMYMGWGFQILAVYNRSDHRVHIVFTTTIMQQLTLFVLLPRDSFESLDFLLNPAYCDQEYPLYPPGHCDQPQQMLKPFHSHCRKADVHD